MTRCFRSACAVSLLGLLPAAAACSSGPAPVDTRPYEQQVLAARAGKDAAFRASDDSPIPVEKRASFQGLAYYPVDPGYRVPASLKLERSETPVVIELETSKGERERYRKVGALEFRLAGQPLRLTAFANVNARNVDRLFVPFGDLTNQSETYRGGRYLELTRTATGLYDLDFNAAYHPYCVYNYEYECPVPPPENRLALAVAAGEKLGRE
jgi:uncharacterized protein (DUF1684 family)